VGTLMRHILLLGAISASPFGMRPAAAPTCLIASARQALCLTTRRLCAARGAVDLAAVAVAANKHLRPAARTEEEAARGLHWRQTSCQGGLDRDWKGVEYFPCTRARHGVGHGIGQDLEV
jgi:hypothetical protein